MLSHILSFHNQEDGAVTVDWVVLTASISFLGAVIVLGVSQAATNPTASIESSLTSMATD